MCRRMLTRSAVLSRVVAIALMAAIVLVPPTRPARAAMSDTHLWFSPVGVTNLQVVRLTYANTNSEPVTVDMDLIGGKVAGTAWNATSLASQKNVAVAPGQAVVLTLDWGAVGGLGVGERAQVYGRVHVNGIQAPRDSVASLEVSDLLGALVPQIVGPQIDLLAEPRPDPITVGYHTIPAIVTNRHAVRLSYTNRYAVPVRVNLSIIGGKMAGATWNADTQLAGQKDLLLGPGQGTVLTLNWAAVGALANNERAQVYARLAVNGVVSPRDSAVGSLQITDLLGVQPGRSQGIEKDGTI